MLEFFAWTACLVLLVIVLLATGASLSLDRRRQHSNAARRLPLFDHENGPFDGVARVAAGGYEFRTRLENFDGDGECLILLHGWPQSAIAWEPVMEAAAAAGYRVVAFDQRGYSPGARPTQVLDYSIDKLVADVTAVADALGIDRFHLAGHDWGAAVGWGVVMSSPERIISWSALSIAHNVSFRDALLDDADQRKRSRYILLLRWRPVGEWLLSFGQFLVMRRIMYRHMPTGHVQEYLSLIAEPGALTAVLNWYRAMGKGPGLSASPEIRRPVLFIWGNRDPAQGRRAIEDQGRYLLGPNQTIELDAGHWLLEHRTAAVIEAILAHLSAFPDNAA